MLQSSSLAGSANTSLVFFAGRFFLGGLESTASSAFDIANLDLVELFFAGLETPESDSESPSEPETAWFCFPVNVTRFLFALAVAQ